MHYISGSWSRPSNRAFRQEGIYEVFYRMRLTESIEISPDIEYVSNPADRVKWVQWRLGIDESGTFDDAMFDKLTEHQKKSGLDPSGIIGPSTFATLCWLNGEK